MDKIDYQKINFRRRTVQYARSYTEESNAGGGITHTPAPGTVLDQGTLPTPENMAYIDGKIKELVDAANALIEEAEALERTVSAQGTSIGNNARGISDAQRVNEQQSAAIAALTTAHNALAEDEEALEMSFNAFAARRDNPNEVTKAQVGLGNVPNVSTNDQTPTFTEAASNQNLVSGEKLSLSLGKIARGLKKLWEHLSDTNNATHKVTKAQVGLGNVPNVTTNNQTPTYTVAEADQELASGETMAVAFGKLKRAVNRLYGHINDTDNPHNTDLFDVVAADFASKWGEPDVTGTFTGNGASAGTISVSGVNCRGQQINLGFAPSKVAIFTVRADLIIGHSESGLNSVDPLDVACGAHIGVILIGKNLNYYHSGCGSNYRTAAPQIVLSQGHGGAVVYGNSFIVQSYNYGNTDTAMHINENGVKYLYMAWR